MKQKQATKTAQERGLLVVQEIGPASSRQLWISVQCNKINNQKKKFPYSLG